MVLNGSWKVRFASESVQYNVILCPEIKQSTAQIFYEFFKSDNDNIFISVDGKKW